MAVMLRVESHPVVSLASPDRITANNLIRCGINDRKNVLARKVDVHLACNGVILRHACLAIEV